MNIALSEIDSRRFGIVVAKGTVAPEGAVGDPAAWCRQHGVRMLIVRCPAERLDIVQRLEQGGAQLMDTLVYYCKRKIAPIAVAFPDGYQVRLATAADANALERLAIQAFSGFSGHYHADPLLNRHDCDMVYGSWAATSCLDKQVADEVLVVTSGGELAGFLTLKRRTADTAEIVLNAVDPRHQGVGLYAALVGLAVNWTAANGLDRLIVSTQLTNRPPQKVWCRHGFEPDSSFYTLHQWFQDHDSI